MAYVDLDATLSFSDTPVMRTAGFSPEVDTRRQRSDWQVIKTLLPFLWPKGDLDIKTRVVVATLCIGLAKAATVLIPLYLKRSVDALAPASDAVAIPNRA